MKNSGGNLGEGEIYGYAGKILRVNLSTEEISIEPTSKYIEKFLGGASIATKILYDEVPPEVKPFDPQNVVIFSTGPLTGTLAPGSGRYTVTTKSPLTGIFSDSNGGGFWSPELKWAGYDHIIVQGKSERPVYLWIDDDDIEIRDACHLWGKTTFETDEMISEELGDSRIQTLCIGPAGENLSLAACILANRSYAAGRTGLGAVVGSKNLKAIAVRGTKGVKIARPDKLKEICSNLIKKIKADPYYPIFSKGGTPSLNDGAHAEHMDVYKYGMTDELYMENFGDLSAERTWGLVWERSTSCFNCPVHCKHWCNIKDGPYAGTKGEGFEYNSLLDFGVMIDVNDPRFVAKAHIRCNELGLGIDEAGLPIAYAMTLFDKGILTEEDTGGMSIRWGDQEVVLKLIDQMAYKEGFGAILSEGSRRVAERIGRGADYYAKHVKGNEIIGDLRWTYGTALSYSVATRGADHLQGMPTVDYFSLDYTPQEVRDEFMKKIGCPHKIDSRRPEPTARLVAYVNKHNAVFNAIELCVFPSKWLMFYTLEVEDIPPLFAAATGIDISAGELYKIGERTRIVQRAYNAREGVRRKDDFPPDFFFDNPVKRGAPMPARKFVLNRKEYDQMLSEYYEIFGCDPKTGIPTRAKLEELGLKEIADDLTERGII